MNPIQFALEIETAISSEIASLADIVTENLPFITLLEQFQDGFLQLLFAAEATNIDIAHYPNVDETKLLGLDTAWQEAINPSKINTNIKVLTKLWAVYTAIDKSVQFYHQAALNNAHPQTRIFFSSLSHVKKILQRRVNGIIQVYDNHYWGELGFAPFMLGKN
ncbi:hypothetical protein SRRS_24710 [Sporomusa rhizae]|uniref:hypothetical protein n=1 Tax=Sporomusa rhizae TaxID=357999 RepID=UPI00352ACC50